MATVIDATKSTLRSYPVLATDTYHAKIIDVTLQDNQYAPQNNGDEPSKELVVTWEVIGTLDEQEDAVIGTRLYQHLTLWYGDKKKGGASKLKAFLDTLVEHGELAPIDPQAIDIDLVNGIEQRIMVERYTKGNGPNAGQAGNRIVGLVQRPKRKPAIPEEKLPEISTAV